ncbi:MAG: hypothetical protein R3B91_13895 [Planctomycetaceae bacterium]
MSDHYAGFDAAVEAAGKVDILINNGQKGHAMDLTNVTGGHSARTCRT